MSLSFWSVLQQNNAHVFWVTECRRRQCPPLSLSFHRSFATKRRIPRRGRRHHKAVKTMNEANKQSKTAKSKVLKIENHKKVNNLPGGSTTTPSSKGWTTFASAPWLTPVRYRTTGNTYTKEQLIALMQRLPLWLLLATLFTWEETSPYSFLTLHGPSMLPTMAPDGSEIWLRSTVTWRRKLGLLSATSSSYYKVGDIVGFAHPEFSEHVSCKRIVGMPGDTVKRYGQYVHLYVHQDPDELGRLWPDDQVHSWIDRDWDRQDRLPNSRQEAQRTMVVPPGHVWLEADCPGLGVDSRHFGPIPVEWLKGNIKGRIWPLWKSRKEGELHVSYKKRPHPIPLDEETLRQYNVHMVSKT